MTEPTGRTAVAVAVAAVSVLSGAVALGASISGTLAQRSDSQVAATEFIVSVAPNLELEGSTDGAEWEDGTDTPLELTFDPDQLSLKVGEGNAVYAPMYVRASAVSNVGALATVVEDGLGSSGFAASLRGEIFTGAATCDAEGVASAEQIATGNTLRGQQSDTFGVPAPAAAGEAGETVALCVKVWMDNNNWLLGGTTPPTETAIWTVTGTAQ